MNMLSDPLRIAEMNVLKTEQCSIIQGGLAFLP